MKKISTGFLGIVLIAAIGVAGLFTYQLSTTSPVTLIVYMGSGDTPGWLKWGAEKALYQFHPTEEETRQLNSEAGARYAALYPDQDQAEQLLRHFLANGVDVNAIDHASGSGVTALHSAVLEKDPFAVRLLLEHGAEVDAAGAQGGTALDFARQLQAQEEDADLVEVIDILEQLGS